MAALELYTTFELRLGDKFRPLDTGNLQWTYLEEHLYGVSNKPFDCYGHTGYLLDKEIH